MNWEHWEEKTLDREERRRRGWMALVRGIVLLALRCHAQSSIYIDLTVEFGRNKHVRRSCKISQLSPETHRYSMCVHHFSVNN